MEFTNCLRPWQEEVVALILGVEFGPDVCRDQSRSRLLEEIGLQV